MSAGVGSVRARGWSRGRGGARVVGGLGGAAMVLLVGLVLAGCAGEPVPEPTYGTPPVSTPTPTPTPTGVTAPERPADMERTDEAGAVAAATYFMELFNYAYRSGQLADWRLASAADCQFCANVTSEVGAATAAGQRYVGGRMSLGEARLSASDATLGVFAIEVPFTIEEFVVIDDTGAPVETVGPEDGVATLEVLHGEAGWTLLGAAPKGPDA